MDPDMYDFVIVGGGTAGLVLAARLSEDPTQRILVIEAGEDLSSDPRVKVPALYETLKGSEADWGFKTTPQPGLNDRSITLNQGKALGGSSAINAHVFVPPADSSLDYWDTDVLGNDGWNRSAIQPYYSKAFTSPTPDESSRRELGIDGWDQASKTSVGPLRLSFTGDPGHPIRKAWADAFRAQGYYMPNDPFHGASVGAFSCLASIDPIHKERSFAASAYYNPIKDRENLKLLTNVYAQKILFEDSGFVKAVGVQYKHNGGSSNVVIASKEVILAAGALQSPKILELSGIGNAELLEHHGVRPILDLPGVGENLQDHLICGISFETIDGLETLDSLIRQEPEALGKAMQDYATSQSGMLTSIGLYTYAYLPVISEEGRKTIKKLLEHQRPGTGESPSEARSRAYHKVAERTLLDIKQPSGAYVSVLGQQVLPVDPKSNSPPGPVPGNFITLGVMLSQPLSRGSTHITSAEPSEKPQANPEYLSNPVDIEVFAQHMLYLETIATSPPLSSLLKQPIKRRDPASELTDIETAKRYLRTSSISMWHPGGTCAMLPKEKGGVVNAQLKVHGVGNLRVVDSSVLPLIGTANIQSTVYAVAERAADLIKGEHGLK